jgi:enoyl-CoA hydratase/carnithine racemase
MVTVRVERPTEHVVTVGFDIPERRNALGQQMVDEIDEVLDAQRDVPSILIFHSTTPGMFISGADIAELRDRTAADARAAINAGLFERIEAHPWPTIAAVDGWALGGGCELAMACDLRIATAAATFGQPELSLGILAGGGGNWRLPALVGPGLARRMLYTGLRIDGTQALDAGLIDALSTPDELLADAMTLAERIGRNSWRALQLTKEALAVHRAATTAFDIEAQAELFESDDKRQRMTAFLERSTKPKGESS